MPSFEEVPTLSTDASGTAPPDAFGPFRVLHQIGAGALGPVFRAYEPEQDRLVAVKLFRLDLPPDRVHRLVAELQRLIAADITHPGLAAPIAAGISDVTAYLAQDFVAAESLDTVIRDLGRASSGDVVRVASQLAGALDLAAAAGLTHGTLHPRDVLMSADDARMTGLGVARTLETLGVSAPIRRPYTAPERAAGGVWDQRADVFSLAALMYELLTARRISGPGEPPADGLSGVSGIVPDVLLRVFAKALEEDPRDRYATAGDFAAALLTGLTGRPSASGRATPVRKRIAPVKPIEAPLPPLAAEHLPLLTDEMLEHDDDESTTREVVLASGLSAASLDLSFGAPVQESPAADDEPPTAAESFALNEFALDDHDLRAVTDDLRLPGHEPDAEVTPHDIEVQPRAPRVEPEREAPAAPAAVLAEATADPARSAVWPLVLALIVGVALGFGSAMLLLGPDQAASVQVAGQTDANRPAPVAIVEEPIRPVPERPTAAAPDTIPEPPALSPVPLSQRSPSAAAASAPAPAVPPTASQPAPAPAAARAKPAPATPAAPSRPAVRPQPSATARPAPRPAPARPAPPTPRPRAVQRPAPAAAAPPATAKPGPGSVVIESRPDGAIVILDGRIAGKTPLTIESLPAGQHAVALDRPGYRRWSSSFQVTSGERSRVAASLER